MPSSFRRVMALVFSLALIFGIGVFLLPDWVANSVVSRTHHTRRGPDSIERYVQLFMKLPYSDRFGDFIAATAGTPGRVTSEAIDKNVNRGLVLFFRSLVQKNGCFDELAARFYDEIKIGDLKQALNEGFPHRPRLDQRLNSKSDPAEGWLWKTALKYANNDKNLAMHLIGACGHDDRGDAGGSLFSQYNDAHVEEAKNNLFKQLLLKYPSLDEDTIRSSYNRMGVDMYSYLQKIYSSAECPQPNSRIYLQGGIGTNTALSADMTQKVVFSQAPTRGPSALPSKYYHVLGGAFVSCLLYERGVPSLFVPLVEQKAVTAYRSTRLCRDIDYYGDTFKILANIGRSTITDQEILKALNENEMNPVNARPPQEGKRPPTIQEYVDNLTPSIIDALKPQEKIARIRMSEILLDAAVLITQQKSWSKLKGCDLDLYGSLEATIDGVSANHCPKSWDKQRCTKALGVLAQWSVDFKWTREQHRTGEQFARENCPAIGMNRDPLRNSCAALEKIKASSRTETSEVTPSADPSSTTR